MLQMDHELMALHSMFQYMIGNTDWALGSQHNVKLLRQTPGENTLPKVVLVPYDFDYCGLVNAEYAVPRSAFKLDDVRQRQYVGFCRNLKTLESTSQIFLDKKNRIYAMIESFEQLPEKDRADMLKYLDSFFSLLESPGEMEKKIREQCK